MATGEMDGDWFRKQLVRVGKSQNALGAHLGIAGSQSSRLFNGTRKMKFDEVPKIARFLGVTVEEVLIHAGLPVNERTAKPVAATEIVDGDSKVSPAREPIPLPASLVDKIRGLVPMDRADEVTTALIVAPKGALNILNDQVVVYENFAGKPPEMGTLSMAKLVDGIQVMGRVESGSKTGDVTLEMFDGEKRKVKVAQISKVVGILQ